MKLLSVRLTNIFAYFQKEEIDLSLTRDERNVILIWGRNGKGKTSFINSMKLLFAGIESERRRTVGFPPRPLPHGQFVRGDGEHWIGVVNRQAARQAERERRPVTASVAATFVVSGQEITAERAWTVADGMHTEALQVTDGSARLTGDAAAQRLADILPPDYVDFFFFDGEDIKALAETAERKSVDFDRLLRITFVAELAGELRNVAVERRRRTMDVRDREQLRSVERTLQEARADHREATRELASVEEELTTRGADLRRQQTVRDNLSSGASDAQREILERNLKSTQAKLLDAVNAVVASVPAHSPLVANLPLVGAALAELERRVGAAAGAEAGLIRRINEQVPAWIANAKVDLDEGTRVALVVALRAGIASMANGNGNLGLFADLDVATADRVREKLLRFASGGAQVRAAHRTLLMEAHRLRLEADQIRDDLMRLQVGSQANIDRYRAAVEQIASLEVQIAQLNQRKGLCTGRLAEADMTRRTKEAELAELERRLVRADCDEAEARFVEGAERALREVRERMRAAARAEVQRLLNQRFRQLVFDHSLIDRIEIDDTYTLTFFDEGGRRIGRASLSSGLKQLAATALLWAMKDAVGIEMPVIIDTPLGRIDRENQDNMLVGYYPRLSEQVILLPTNAEIDSRKKRMLEPFIADEWRINNDEGDAATFEHRSLVEV